LKGKDGIVTGVLSSAHDITERKHSEELLKQTEFKFRTFAEYTYDWEYWEDENNKTIYMSPSCERITGYTSEDFNSNPELLNSIIHPDDLESVGKHHAESYSFENRNNLYEIEFRVIKKDGSVIYIQHTCRPIFNEDKKFLGRRVSNRDITERKLVEEELYKHREQLEELVKERTKELEEKNKELDEFNQLFVGREFRIKELRDKVKELELQLKK